MRQRFQEIIDNSAYSRREKRIRAMSQLERVLEVVVESLPQEQRQPVEEMLKLYDALWRLEE